MPSGGDLVADCHSKIRILGSAEVSGTNEAQRSKLLTLPPQALRYRIAVHVITQKANRIQDILAIGRYGGGEHLELLRALVDREDELGRIILVGWMGELEFKNSSLKEGVGVISQVLNTSGTGHFLRQLWSLKAQPEERQRLLLTVGTLHRPFIETLVGQVHSVQLENSILVTQLQASLPPEIARWTSAVDFNPDRPHLYADFELFNRDEPEGIGDKRHALSNNILLPAMVDWPVDSDAARYDFPDDIAESLAHSLETLAALANLFHLEGEVLNIREPLDNQLPYSTVLRDIDAIQFLRAHSGEFSRARAIWPVQGLNLNETAETVRASSRALAKLLQAERDLIEIWLLALPNAGSDT
ncbi:MAG: hypothetical protein EA369_08085 [Bradymonadales bacterium]|nr:MAG: hypothetical protein EA369_08085 [Bradymonadales bacterium]